MVKLAFNEECSRELWLRCDVQGTIQALDARAERILGTRVGRELRASLVPGSEEKLASLLSEGRKGNLRNWELALIAFGKPATLSFCAQPGEAGDVELHASVLPDNYGETVQHLNQTMNDMLGLHREISRQKKELEAKTNQLLRAYRELDESNRGVVALHAELAEKAETLRHSADVRGRVVANVSHEFRTPLHTILGLSKLLLDASDGPLTDEQQKQIRFIRSSAEELSALVNDMLDLSKAESGKAQLRVAPFSVADLFAALRGQLRPLLPLLPTAAHGASVELQFDDPPEDASLETDQGKVAQILRNLISNALKFTEQGQVRVSVRMETGMAYFTVSDTGIGIAPEDFERVFEEFGQVDSPLQAKVKGTGLGLPLSKKYAELLGGSLEVESEAGKGSTFRLAVPCYHPEAREIKALEARPLDPEKAPVLVVEDDRKTIFIYEKYLAMAGFQVVPARNIEHARNLLTQLRPAAIVLDIMLDGETSWNFLAEVKRDPRTRDIPVLVVTITNKEHKARALGADEFWLKPVDQDRLLRKLRSLSKPGSNAKVLVIDDDDRARYLMRKYLEKEPYTLLECANGPDGIKCAREQRPHVILLDFLLRDMTAFDVLDDLKGDPRTRGIPVVIVTSHMLDASERKRLAAETEVILSKASLSRELAIHRIRDALQKAGVSKWSTTAGES
jgi:signal transduction histidine kinase/CheY-like chemotaxis protein